MDELELETTINIQKLGYQFLDKPVVVGGLAMEYYGLRTHGDDVDFIVTDRDYQRSHSESAPMNQSLTMRAPDWWESARFQAVSVA